MATTIQSALSYADPAWTGNPGGGVVHRISKSQTFNFVNADTNSVKFFKLPPNAKILNGGIFGTDVGAAGTANLKVTDDTTTKSLLSAADIHSNDYSYDALAMSGSTAGGAVQTGGVLMASWRGFVTTNNKFYVVVDFGTQPSDVTGATLQAYIEYTMDVETGQATG